MSGFRGRHKVSKRHSRKLFSTTAQYIHPRNVHKAPMRGGFRLQFLRGEGGDSALFCAFGVCEVSEYMGCVKPLQGQILADGQWKPSKAIARNFYEYGIDSPGRVAQPCGQCVSCLVDHSREWAVKMQHEASLWPSNLFVTLTFNDAGLKKMCPDGSLNKDHMVAFMKDLRREMDDPVRVYYCGDYGENRDGRPW